MDQVVSKSELVAFRDGVPSDYPFIYASWLRGLRHGSAYHEMIDNDAYFKHQHRVIEKILEDDFEALIRIACLKDSPDVILGYSVFRNDQLHLVFVKRSWRGIGLAKDLVPENIKEVSHITKVGASILQKRPGIIFNPY